jgi:hypothetical protein
MSKAWVSEGGQRPDSKKELVCYGWIILCWYLI